MGARVSSVWCVGVLSKLYGFTPAQADEVWGVLSEAEPAQSPSGFIAQFEGVASSLGVLPPLPGEDVFPADGSGGGVV